MNYSDYFSDKVEAILNNKFNVVVTESSHLTSNETITKSVLFDSFKEVSNFIDQLDPYNVVMSGNIITLRTIGDATKKA